MGIPEFLVAVLGTSGLIEFIKFLITRKAAVNSLAVISLKTAKEVEQIEQEISSQHALQVKRWFDDLNDIKEKHDRELAEKNRFIESLHNQYVEAIKTVSDSKVEAAQIQRSMRRLFVNLEIPYWECDGVGELEYANGRWLQLFGLDLADAQGEGWLNGIPEEDRNALIVEWSSKVVDQADGQITFRVQNAITKEIKNVKALYVLAFGADNEINKIFGTTIEIN